MGFVDFGDGGGGCQGFGEVVRWVGYLARSMVAGSLVVTVRGMVEWGLQNNKCMGLGLG